MMSTDTIAAIATAPGRAGVGIVRVSGILAQKITTQILRRTLRPRYAHYLPFFSRQGDILDQGIALFFPGPESFTGEDVLELQAHGGPVLLDMLLAATLACGARLARPGEFSERAFLNHKMDLVQAEAIADLIDASSQQAVRGALRSLCGEFSRRIESLLEQLVFLRTYVEAAIDFTDEEIDFLSDGKVLIRLETLRSELAELLQKSEQGAVLREGLQVVIAGRPNAGKSSLLNALAGKERAIVTEVPGTTRDTVCEQLLLQGLPVQIIDTAGLRESEDPIERIGIKRTWEAIAEADCLLLVVDGNAEKSRDVHYLWSLTSEHPLPTIPVLLIVNKADLSGEAIACRQHQDRITVVLSARKRQGIDVLQTQLLRIAGLEQTGETGFLARRRHLDALRQAQQALDAGYQQLTQNHAGELLAEELRLAQRSLGEITGDFSADDLLGQIFGSFCVGK